MPCRRCCSGRLGIRRWTSRFCAISVINRRPERFWRNWRRGSAASARATSTRPGADIEAARASARKVSRNVRANGSSRGSMCVGSPREGEPPGTMLLWFFDTSAGEEERAKLALRLRQTEGALDSLTHLIEAAPFPMWFRGPDLKLGLVNSAFVQAVEANDAADVIDRGANLSTPRARTAPLPALARAAGGWDGSFRGCSRRSFAANVACCALSTCPFRAAPWPASRSTCRTWRMHAPELERSSNCSASWRTG